MACLIGAGAGGGVAAQEGVRLPDQAIVWRLGVARLVHPFPLDTIWRATAGLSLSGAIPLRRGFLEFGVAGASLTAVDTAAFDITDVVAHPPDILLLRPFAGLGWSRGRGPLRPWASGRIGVDIVRFDPEGFETGDPVEMEWSLGAAGGLAWWPAPSWGLGLEAGARHVFNRERAWFYDVGGSVTARLGLPSGVSGLLADPPGEDSPADDGGCRARRPGTLRLSGWLEDEPRWRSASVWGFRGRFAASGAQIFEGAQPIALLDGLPLGPDVFGTLGLDRQPLDVGDLVCLDAADRPEVAMGRLEGRGVLRMTSRTPPPGLSVAGDAALGNHEGDAGLWAFSDRASANVDKAYGQSGVRVAFRGGPAWLRVGVGPRYLHPTAPEVHTRTSVRWPEGGLIRLWVRPVWAQGQWEGEGLRIDALAGTSGMNDLVWAPRRGTESLDSSSLAHAAVRVQSGIGGTAIDGGASWSRSRLHGPRDRGRAALPLGTTLRRVHLGGARGDAAGAHMDLAAGWIQRSWEGPGTPGQVARTWIRLGTGTTTPGQASVRADAQLARDGGRLVPAGRARVGVPLAKGWRGVAEASTTALGPLDDDSDLAAGPAARLGDGGGAPGAAWRAPGDRLWALDLGAEREGGFEAGASLRHHASLAWVVRTRAVDPVTVDALPRIHATRTVDATLAAVWGRMRGSGGPIHGEVAFDAPVLLSGGAGAREVLGPSAYPVAVVRVAWRLDPRVELWGRVRARGGADWPEFAGLAEGTNGFLSERVAGGATADLGASVALAAGALTLEAVVRNVTGRLAPSHPMGAGEVRGLHVRGAFDWSPVGGR